MARLTSILDGLEGCWSRRLRIDRLVARAGNLLVKEVRMNSPSGVGRNLEVLRHTEFVAGTLADHNLEEGLVADSPGRSLVGTGCMGLT